MLALAPLCQAHARGQQHVANPEIVQVSPLPPVPLGKLPDTVRPIAYRLDLTVDPARELFSGKVEIDARLAAASDVVFLHGRDLVMRRAVALTGGKAMAGEWQQADPTGVAVLRFPSPLPAGPVTFAFEYEAPFSESPAGMFRVKVGEDWYSWTQFESIDARAAFPSFDEPGFKTPFTVTLRTRPGQVAVSNAPLLSSKLEEGQEVHRFATTLPLPTYLVAFMTGPFATVEALVPPTPQRAAPLPLRVVATRQYADRLAFALEGSKDIVVRLEDYFGEAFPFPKLDQIASPVLPGAMENAGANLFNDTILIVDEKASVKRKRTFGMVVGHELAHQWFGDLVTPAWWDDIWLNESFANWMGYRVASQWRPDLKIAAGANGEGFAAMDTDALLAGRPIRQKITANNQIDSAFDAITYGKGGQVLAMFAAFMGDEKFRDGVRRYLAARRYGSATSDDFFAALAEAAGDPRIVPALRGFTDQQGVPLLTFGRKGNRFTVSQSRYAPLGVTAPATRWTVPLCVRREAARHCIMLDQASGEIEVKGSGPLVPNADGAGYYRFELPDGTWDSLIARADRLPATEALAVADSLMASFRAGRTGATRVFRLARKLARNPDSRANDIAADLLDGINEADLIDLGAAPAYRAFVGRLFGPMLAKAGFNPVAGAYAGEEPGLSQRRRLAVARMARGGRDRGLRRSLAEAGSRYLAGDTAALDPAWFDLAFDFVLETGRRDAAKELVGKALASEDSVFRSSALAAIAASGDRAVAQWLLDDFRDKRLRRSEQIGLLRGVLEARQTRDFGYDWLRDHLGTLVSGNNGIFFASRLPQMLGGFCSIERAREFARDLRPRLAGKPGELELERAIERVRNCGVLHDTLSAVVSAELSDLR